MSIRLYNTLTRQTEPFETLTPNKVSMYVKLCVLLTICEFVVKKTKKKNI